MDNQKCSKVPDNKSWYKNWLAMSEEDRYNLLKDQLVNIQTIGIKKTGEDKAEGFTDKNTPFDAFDASCHDEHISRDLQNLDQEELMFMINTSEHVKRPQDMLIFLGEYFKTHI